MKNIKYLLVGIFALFAVTLNVDAITDESELATCLSGSEGSCVLANDIEVTSAILLNGREVTIDLAGKTLTIDNPIVISENSKLTITGNGTVSGNAVEHLFRVNPTGSLYLEEAKYENKTADAVIVNLFGNTTDSGEKTYLKVSEGAYLTANYGIIVKHAGNNSSYGVVVDYAGDFQGITNNNGYDEGTVGIFVNGNLTKNTGNIPEINITGGTIKTVKGTTGSRNDDSAPALGANGYAKWNISGGEITGTEAISAKAGKFNITGGKFTAFGEYYDPAKSFGDGTEATGAAISITATKNYAGSVEVSISNAEVTSKNGHAIYEGISVDAAGNKSVTESALKNDGMKISSGTYTSAEGKKALEIEKELTEFISGGEFSTEVDKEQLSASMSGTKLEDGTYLVGEKHNIILPEVTNGVVSADKKTAIAGETVKVTVTANEGYEVKNIKVNNVELKDGKFIMPDKDVKIEVTFEKIVANDVPVTNVDTNPKTGDEIFSYLTVCLIAILGLTYTLKQKRID